MFKEKKKFNAARLWLILVGVGFSMGVAQAEEDSATEHVTELTRQHMMKMVLTKACSVEMGQNFYRAAKNDFEHTVYVLTHSHRQALECADKAEAQVGELTPPFRRRIAATPDLLGRMEVCITMNNNIDDDLKRAKIKAGLLK